MSDETKNNEGPACACGRVDIYKEMLKAKKANNDDDSAASGHVENDGSSDSEESKEDKRKTKG